MSIEPTIHQLLLHLANSSEPTSGMLFYQQVSSINMDYSPESLTQLDSLLGKIANKAKADNRFQVEALLKRTNGNVFFLSLAAYIGNYIAKELRKKSNKTLQWYGDASLLDALKLEPTNQKTIASLIMMVGTTPYFPLTILIECLENPNDKSKSITSFIESTLQEQTRQIQASLGISQTISQPPVQQANSLNTNQNYHEPHNTNHVNSAQVQQTSSSHHVERVSIEPDIVLQLQNQKDQIKEHQVSYENQLKRLVVAAGLILFIFILLVMLL